MSCFRFKAFSVRQERCAMKVGTDGVLLGAWASGGKRVLDIGSGTGLIALMMAQRFPDAEVVGIDMDSEACGQAQENVLASPFADRVSIACCRLQDYGLSDAGETDHVALQKYDAVVSNPPFFLNSMKNPDQQRSMARHADSLPFRDLLQGAKRLMTADALFSVILPAEVIETFTSEAYLLGLCLVRRCAVKTVVRKTAKRYLLTFSQRQQPMQEDQEVCLMDSDGNRSIWYAEITRDFYL